MTTRHCVGDVGEFLDQSSAVSAVIDWYGPMNLLSIGSQHAPGGDKNPDAAGLVGVVDGRRAVAGRPGAHARGQPDLVRTCRRARRCRSTMARSTRSCPYAQSVEFADALRNAGGDVELIAVDGSDHFWTGAPDVTAIFDRSLAFARRITNT